MPFVPFHDMFPELAERETRTLTIFEGHALPAGEYGLIEMYCDEPGCDCRRVFFSVLSVEATEIVAYIAYGWESEPFYARWLGFHDPDMIKELKGPVLNLGSPQSKLAPAVLQIMKEVVLRDERYVERLKTHYAMFREVIDRQTKARGGVRQKKSGSKKRAQARKRRRKNRRS
jgi:hypothetical protein